MILNSKRLINGFYLKPELTQTLIEGEIYTFSADAKGNLQGNIFFNEKCFGQFTAGNFADFTRISTSFTFRRKDYQGALIYPHIYGATEFKNIK